MITQAIRTKYLGPPNYRGSQIKAMSWAGSITIPLDYSLNIDAAHAKAAQALADKLGWPGKWAQGGNDKGEGYFFVNVG